MDSKSMSSVQIKDADQGRVEAVFSTFGVVDHDGDVTDPSAFKHGAKVLISAYNHQSWQGALPVGKGHIEVGPQGAILKGQFFMNTQHGRDTFNTVKALAEEGMGEWSYGFQVQEAEHEEFEGKSVRVLKKLDVFEVSPVLKGAGVGTHTAMVKIEGSVEGDEGKFSEMFAEAIKNAQRGYGKKPQKRDFSAEERRHLADSGKAMPDGSFPIVNEEDLRNAIHLAGKADNPSKARAHIRRRARALGKEDMIPDDWKSSLGQGFTLEEVFEWVEKTGRTRYRPDDEDDDKKKPRKKPDDDEDMPEDDEEDDDEKRPPKKKPKGKRFSEHAESVVADIVEFRARVAEVMAMRSEKGRALGDESAELVTKVREELKALDDLLAQQRPDNTELMHEWLDSIRDEYLGGYDE
jgi:phage head maturation protease